MRRRVLALVPLLASVPALAAAQCAMCRNSLTGSAEGARLALGMNHAILFLLAAPFVLAALFGALVASRRKRAAEVAS